MDPMSRLAAGAHHKRKGSALDHLGEGQGPASGKAARPGEAEAQQEEAAAAEEQRQEQEAKEQEPLTQTCSMHLLQLRTSQEELLKKIDAITAAGTAFLDQLRASFLSRMERVKGELTTMVDDAEEALRLQSASTLDCCRRAELTATLIAKLGIRTVDVEQQRPDTIESVQEEGEAPGAGSAGAAQ
ncbi:hypothetical protein ABPG75_006474 [Micractinium tetrahymenae]